MLGPLSPESSLAAHSGAEQHDELPSFPESPPSSPYQFQTVCSTCTACPTSTRYDEEGTASWYETEKV
jgi:rare lipoprotein A (peptidoglycan hydrolase)